MTMTRRARTSALRLLLTISMLVGAICIAGPALAAPSGYIWLSKRTVPDWPLRRDGNFARTTGYLSTSLDGRYGLISAGTANPAHPGGDWTSIYLSDSFAGQLTLASTDEQGQKFASTLVNVNGILSPHGTWMAWTHYDPTTTFSTVFARDNRLGRVFRSISNDNAQGALFVTDDGKVYGNFHASPAAGAPIEVWNVPGSTLSVLQLQPQPGPAYVATMSGDGRTAIVVSGGKYLAYDVATAVTSPLPLAVPPKIYVNAISQTGRYIGFTSEDPSLNPEGLTKRHVYLFDRVTGTTTWISAPGHGGTSDPAVNYWLAPRSISDDGRFVIFGAEGVQFMPPLDPAHAGERVLYFYGGTFERDVRAADTRLVVASYANGIAPNAGVVQFDTFSLDSADPPGDFDVYLSGAPNPRVSAPSVSVTGISAGANYEFGAVPTASCSAVDSADGTSVFSATLTGPSGPRAADGLGSVTASCAYTNSAGVSDSASASYSIVDTTGPSVSVPDGVHVEASGKSTPVSFVVTAVDLVDGSRAVSCDHAIGSGFPVGKTVVNCGANDVAGNTASATFEVTVVDTTAPTLTLPSSVTVAATGSSGAVATYSAPTADDAVDGSVAVTCDHPSGALFAFGTTVVTCTAKDAAGNTATGSFTIRVQDQGAPVISVPAPLTIEASGPNGAAANYPAVTAVDDIDGVLPATCDHASGAVLPLATTVVTCTATDRADNTGSSTFTVTIVDTTAPTVIVPAHKTAEATGPLGATVTFPAAAASDAVDGSVMPTCTNSSGDPFGLGDTIVTCTAVDRAGNSASATFVVTVNDSTGPVVTVPAAATEEASGPDGTHVNYSTATAIDTVDGPIPVSCTPASGSIFRLGLTTVTCTASDAHGNTSSGSVTVTVTDSTPPRMVLPANQTKNATGPSGVTVDFSSPTAIDTVDGTVSVACDHQSGTVYPLGTTTITCTASDHAANVTRGSFTVSVIDADSPAVTVPSTITAEAGGPNGAIVTYPVPSSHDTVDGDLPVTCDHASGATYPLGDTTVTCSATDKANNASTNTFTIRVVDTTPPSLTHLADQVVTATTSNGASVSYTPPTATDLVNGGLSVGCTPSPATTFSLGTTKVTCTATDAAGNVGSTSFQVVVTYSWSGLLQPVSEGATYRLGGTVPVRFSLTGASTGITTATARLWLAQVAGGSPSSEITATPTGSATSGNTFRYDPTNNLYIFNLSTKSLEPGKWRLRIDLGDGSSHVITITLTR
ncbi:HYR domain-containing protein [Lentzea kentuckyensis]|uniref:HYR domain-containing protein n=1 Tax=Lentzea kentuckyensis TaxID=360086 RepID=UPI000A3A0D53|nr:HYR domain-containing protein [Lentzea kentuckyensis]